MALDQRAVNEQVAITNSLQHLDSFLAGFFRDGGGDVGPVITTAATERCEISMSRPKTIPGVCVSLYHDDCLNGPIRLIYLSLRLFLIHLPLRLLFTCLSGFYSPVSDFFIATIQIGVVKVCYTPLARLPSMCNLECCRIGSDLYHHTKSMENAIIYSKFVNISGPEQFAESAHSCYRVVATIIM